MVGENEKIYSPHEVLERLNRVAPQIHSDVKKRHSFAALLIAVLPPGDFTTLAVEYQ